MGMGFPFCSARRSCGEATARLRASPGYKPAPQPEPAKLPNPDPQNFQVLQHKRTGNALAVMVRYPDCTNYEGVKIMVYRNVTLEGLIADKSLDPHFCEHAEHSPIARFVPTEEGWTLALQLCKWLAKRGL